MLRRERDLIFKGTNRAPTYPPCSRGWVPVLETSVVGCRPARVLVFNLPIKMLGKHATALGQVAAVKECDRRRTSQRHESMGALLGLILTPPHQIPHESGKAASIGMAETFDCVHMGTQHSSAVVLEMVWKESSLVGLRVHYLIFHEHFYAQRSVGLQIHNNARLERKRLCTPQARVGTKKRMRDQEEDDAHEKALQVPDPSTARDRVLCVSDYLNACNDYTNDGEFPLTPGPLKPHLMSGKGSASALELLDASAASVKYRSGEERLWHAAAPELLFFISSQALAANVPSANTEYMHPRSYLSSNGFRLPHLDDCWLLIPSARIDAMTTALPESVQRHVRAEQLMRGCDGLVWSPKPIYEPIKKPARRKRASSTELLSDSGSMSGAESDSGSYS